MPAVDVDPADLPDGSTTDADSTSPIWWWIAGGSVLITAGAAVVIGFRGRQAVGDRSPRGVQAAAGAKGSRP